MKLRSSSIALNMIFCLAFIFGLPTLSFDSSNKLKSNGFADQVLPIKNLWVDSINGKDSNDGLTPSTPFKTIQKASDIAIPGTTVNILPGIYRESVWVRVSGNSAERIVFRAEGNPGAAVIRGSDPSSSLIWTQLETNTIDLRSGINPANIYYADLSSWDLDGPPRFIVELDENGQVKARLPLAREPDWQVITEWKYHEFWWAADGGSTVASCDPVSNTDTDCDISSRSTTQLTDRHNDSQPVGIEPGNLATLGDLTGATLVALDTASGHYVYRRKIVAHDISTGKITVDQSCEFDKGSGRAGLGWGTKYYIENKPALLDTPGEWWYDQNTSRLYIWPSTPVNPANLNLEISRRDSGFQLNSRSYISVFGLTMEFFNRSAIHQSQSCPGCGSYSNIISNVSLRYANIGIELGQGADYPTNVTDGFTLKNSVISHMDTLGFYSNYWWPGGTADSFTHAGITNTLISNNEFFDLGFRSDNDNTDGIQFNYPDNLRFEGNHVSQVAHNGVILGRSIIQSDKERGFSPGEIKTGQILIQDNVIEQTCLLATDCGGLKIEGGKPDYHVFRDLLITGNIFRNILGWTSVSEKRNAWSGGTASLVRGMGGFGLYLDNASGVYVYRNIAYNNAFSGFHLYNYWWDGDIVIYNNILANSLNGIRLDGRASQGSINTQIYNNILVNNEGYGVLSRQGNYGNIFLDHNLYFNNGWRSFDNGGVQQAGDMAISDNNEYYETLAAIQANTPWEDFGVQGDPNFWEYNLSDHDLFDLSWPDFQSTSSSSNPIDHGTADLPSSLLVLLDKFGVVENKVGANYDIGRYESGFFILAAPSSQWMFPGTTVHFTLKLVPADTRYSVTLSSASPSPYLTLNLSPSTITGEQVADLMVSDLHSWPLEPRVVYILPINGSGAGFTSSINLYLRVGGTCVYLPLFFPLLESINHWSFY